MKKFISIAAFITIVALLSVVFCPPAMVSSTNDTPEITIKALTYTYDGPVDPGSFVNWEVVRANMCRKGHFHVVVKNPDQSTGIDTVETISFTTPTEEFILMAYQYMKDGVGYVFYLDITRNHYTQVRPAPTDKSKGI